MQPLTVRRTKQASPKMPIRFIMAVAPLDIYVAWYNFTARLQPIFSGGIRDFNGTGLADISRIFIGS
jgi:hypothetical protein